MRAILILAAIGWASTARADDQAACILAAAARLPHIQGLVIVGSSTRPESTVGDKQLANLRSLLLVEVKVAAVGQRMTYQYLCGMPKSGLPQIAFVKGIPTTD